MTVELPLKGKPLLYHTFSKLSSARKKFDRVVARSRNARAAGIYIFWFWSGGGVMAIWRRHLQPAAGLQNCFQAWFVVFSFLQSLGRNGKSAYKTIIGTLKKKKELGIAYYISTFDTVFQDPCKCIHGQFLRGPVVTSYPYWYIDILIDRPSQFIVIHQNRWSPIQRKFDYLRLS